MNKKRQTRSSRFQKKKAKIASVKSAPRACWRRRRTLLFEEKHCFSRITAKKVKKSRLRRQKVPLGADTSKKNTT